MVFNSIPFLVFLPLVFFLFWFVAGKSLKGRNVVLLLASYVFYGWWDWRFLTLIIISSATDFFIGKALGAESVPKKRKSLLIASLVINLGILGFFKYFNFFVDSLKELAVLGGLSINLNTLDILLPVGISFYTFQSLSYTLDIYRDKIKPSGEIISFFTFVAFFPQLVAGPIERASNLLPQFLERRKFNYEWAISGCRLFLWGMFKKVVIADGLITAVEAVYSTPEVYPGWGIMMAAILFSFQVYADFSGYSDMAIGIARLFGFDLMTNFRTPFFSKSIKEFWQRWHISLSTWFRDYLYISMGGNRVSVARWLFNLFFTFLISGIWHGASWNFVVWGALFGVVFAIEAWVTHYKFFKFKLPGIVMMLYPFFIFALSVIFFRAESTADAFLMVAKVFTFSGDPMTVQNLLNFLQTIFGSMILFWQFLLCFIVLILVDAMTGERDFNLMVSDYPRPVRWGIYYGLTFLILYFGTFDVAPGFIYFQF